MKYDFIKVGATVCWHDVFKQLAHPVWTGEKFSYFLQFSI